MSKPLVLAVIAILAAHTAAAQSCDPGIADIRDGGSSLRFQVEVADSAEERAKGLMFRETMPRFSGMLFVYETPQPVAFWMENTLIPLDMLFFDAQGKLVSVHENAVPHDRTPIPGGNNIEFVLEINGGQARTLGIKPGAELRHPAISRESAAWPCD